MQRKGITNVQFIIMVALLVNLTVVLVATQKFFKENIGRMRCTANIRHIMQAEQIYHAYYNLGRKSIEMEKVGAVDLQFLVSKGFLPYALRCAHGGAYKWDSEGELYCTYHGFGEIY